MKSISSQFRKLISFLQNSFSALLFESSSTSENQSENVSNFLANRLFSLAWAMTSKQRKREVRKRIEIAKPVSSAYFDLFNSTVIDDDSEWNIFSEFTSILQRLQQLQFLHRKSNLFDLLQNCLMSFALNWFKNQSKFISLHDFDIVLTNAFFFKQINSSSRSISASKSICEIFESSTSSALINRTDSSTSFASRE